MRPPDEREDAGAAAMIAAESALGRGRFLEARQQLVRAARLGASRDEIERLRGAVEAGVSRRAQQGRLAPWMGFGIGLAGYLVLALRQPPGWTVPAWALLAFLVVPGIAGTVTGRWLGGDQEARGRFWAGASAGGAAMALYSGFSLIALRQRFRSGPDSAEDFLAGLFVMAVYAVLAGLVAGLASRLARGWGGDRDGLA